MTDSTRQPNAKSAVHSVQNRLSSCAPGPVRSSCRLVQVTLQKIEHLRAHELRAA